MEFLLGFNACRDMDVELYNDYPANIKDSSLSETTERQAEMKNRQLLIWLILINRLL